MSSEDARCFQTSPPSPARWIEHKAKIIELYQDFTLKEVQKVMEDQYSFHASKRMYDRKLKDWQVTKYLKSKDKEKLADILTQTGTWMSKSPSPNMEPIQIDDDSYRKVLRHMKTKNRRLSAARGSNADRGTIHHRGHAELLQPSEDSQLQSQANRVLLSSQATSCISDDDNSYDRIQRAVTEISESWDALSADPNLSDLELSPATSTNSGRIDEYENEHPTDPMFSVKLDSTTPYVEGVDSQTAVSSLRLIPHGNKNLNVEVILKSVYVYLDHLTQPTKMNQSNSSSQDLISTSNSASDLWLKLKEGIYLLKVGSPNLAWPALDHACSLAYKVLADPTNLDFWFLREMFLTLSPVNTRIFPMIRTVLLQYLRYLVCMNVSSEHPIAAIFHELQHDDHDREVSEKALSCMLDAIQAKFGDHDPSGVAFELHCSTIKLLRRDGDLELAAIKARSLVQQSRCMLLEAKAYDSSVDSTLDLLQKEARMAATELAHVLMDQRGSYRAEAIQMSMYVLLGESKAWSISYREAGPVVPETLPDLALIPDKMSMYAMEDLAKTYEELGRFELAIGWLTRAQALAEVVLSSGEDRTAKAHIVEKINRLILDSHQLG